MLHECQNSFIDIYWMIKEILNQQTSKAVQLTISSQIQLVIEEGFNQCCMNLFTVNKLAVILPDKYNKACFWDIVISLCQSGNEQHCFLYVYPNHAAYMPLQYPLLFFHSNSGWTWSFQLSKQSNRALSKNKLTQQMYYWYHLFQHSN